MDTSEIQAALQALNMWTRNERMKWQNLRDMFADSFWRNERSASAFLGGDRPATRTPLAPSGELVEINRLKAWLKSYVASLFYKNLHSEVRANPILNAPAEVDLDPTPIQVILDLWLETAEVRAVTKRAYAMALMYPHAAFRLCIDPDPKKHPLKRVYLDHMPPWECVWERRAPSERAARYRGRVYHIPAEVAKAQYAAQLPADYKWDLQVLGDLVQYGPEQAHVDPDGLGIEANRAYVKVLEFYDYTEVFVPSGDPAAPPPAAGPASYSERGVYKIFVVDGLETLTQVHSGPIPLSAAGGGPLDSIIPIVMTSLPEFPFHGVSEAGTPYEMSRELNHVATYTAQAFRKDSARVLMSRKGSLDEPAREALLSGKDHILSEVNVGFQMEDALKWLESPQFPATAFQYRELLESALREITVPVPRGEPTKYASAAESNRFAEYTETDLGLYREEMDRGISRLCAIYLRAVQSCMTESGIDALHVRTVNREVVTVTRESLDHQWLIALADSQNTPYKEQQRRMQLSEVQPVLVSLAMLAAGGPPDQPVPPTVALLAQRILDLYVEYFDLPDSLRWERIAQDAPPPIAAPAPASTPAGPGASASVSAPPAGGATPPPEAPAGISDEQAKAINVAAAQAAQGSAPEGT